MSSRSAPARWQYRQVPPPRRRVGPDPADTGPRIRRRRPAAPHAATVRHRRDHRRQTRTLRSGSGARRPTASGSPSTTSGAWAPTCCSSTPPASAPGPSLRWPGGLGRPVPLLGPGPPGPRPLRPPGRRRLRLVRIRHRRPDRGRPPRAGPSLRVRPLVRRGRGPAGRTGPTRTVPIPLLLRAGGHARRRPGPHRREQPAGRRRPAAAGDLSARPRRPWPTTPRSRPTPSWTPRRSASTWRPASSSSRRRREATAGPSGSDAAARTRPPSSPPPSTTRPSPISARSAAR